MALDVKSRAKRYEKLDFVGEGQVGSEIFHFVFSLSVVLVSGYLFVFLMCRAQALAGC